MKYRVGLVAKPSPAGVTRFANRQRRGHMDFNHRPGANDTVRQSLIFHQQRNQGDDGASPGSVELPGDLGDAPTAFTRISGRVPDSSRPAADRRLLSKSCFVARSTEMKPRFQIFLEFAIAVGL